jgi:hypothetical protein
MPLPVASVPRPQVQASLLHALGDTPVVWLAGASRTGKSTLLREVQAALPGAACSTFADPATLAEAARDPEAFLAGLPGVALLDDVDRIPALVPLFKAASASGRRFLLTTTRVLPGLAASLSWSLERFTLWPLAQAEREGVHPGLIDACFQGEPARLNLQSLTRQELLERLLAGGFPEVAGLGPSLRATWFHDYLAVLVRGRLRDLTDLREVHHLIRALAAPDRRLLEFLEDCHLMASLASGPGARSRWFLDAALQAQILGMGGAALATQPALAAPLLATFAVMELVKTAPWSGARPKVTHLRAGAQDLVVLEDHRQQLVAFAVCATATVQPEAFQGLRALGDRVGARLRAGVVLHAGGAARAAGPGLWAVPFQALWAARG